MEKVLAFIEKGKRLLAVVRERAAQARKALVPAVAALGLIVGTDSPTYVDVVTVLVALGVYAVPNVPRAR